MKKNLSDLIAKYDVAAPRYTSYPTVPYWSDSPTVDEWMDSIRTSLKNPSAKIALYVHLPFCETLCTFCGCNNSITKNHTVEEPYLETLFKEIDIYTKNVEQFSINEVAELHFGGGSPTYLSEKNLDALVSKLKSSFRFSPNADLSVEVDPRRTRVTQLEVLYSHGFRRISLGVQDFNEEVQRLINRFQPYQATEDVTLNARKLGYTSVNFDLIYGLPRQTAASVEDTMKKTLQLRPDRIAFYSYAHVPWIKASQRLFTEDDLPSGKEKRELYELGRNKFLEAGYVEIGMDHFALPEDGLNKSYLNGTMHRNFMGYTEKRTELLLGLGVSAISDSWNCFYQNEKILKKYQRILHEDRLPSLRGHKLTEEDVIQRKLILDLTTTWRAEILTHQDSVKSELKTMEDDGLVRWEGNTLYVTEAGRPFLRNACMALDLRFHRSRPDRKIFSQAI